MTDAPVSVLRDLVQPMRDGTRLRADVYLPEGPGPFPALVERTPYGKDNSPELQGAPPPSLARTATPVAVRASAGAFASKAASCRFTATAWGPPGAASAPASGSPARRGARA